MSTAEPIGSPRKPGRPRSSEADAAIIEATIALLAEVGYQALSLERVAALAQVGKKTIYRRWSSKEALVCDAIRSLQSEMPLVDTGTLRDDLIAMHRNALAALATAPIMRPLYLRLASEMNATPSVFGVFLTDLVAPRFDALNHLVRRAQERGEIRSDIDLSLIVDILIGPMLARWMFVGVLVPTMAKADTASFVDELVDLTLFAVGKRSEPDEISA